jgi:hypothetical protein
MGKDKMEFVCVEYYDPIHATGWTPKNEYPTIEESIQIGCGIIIEEDDGKLIIGTGVGKKNKPSDDVLNPFLINKSAIIKITRLYPE